MTFKILDRILDSLLFLILASMAAVVATNVFCRFILHASISWADELAQILMVWLTFLGAAVATREKAHYAFDYLIRSLPEKAKRAFMLLTQLIGIGTILLLLYYSGRVTWGIRSWIMPAMEINRAFVYAAAPVGCLFMLVYAIRNLIQDLHATPKMDEHREGGKAI